MSRVAVDTADLGGAAGESLLTPIQQSALHKASWRLVPLLTLAYFFAGVQKWRYSGLAWVTSDNLRWILYAQPHPSEVALFIADRPWLAHMFAAGSLLLETCFPLVLFVRRLRWLLIPSVIAMHVGIQLAMGLDYSAQWLTLLIVFVDWPSLVDRLRDTVAPIPAPHGLPS